MKEAHGIVVTDVAFVPESEHGRELLAGNEAALLSVAVDSRCKLHLLPARRTCVGLWGRDTPRDPTSQPPLPPPQDRCPSGCCCCCAPRSSWAASCCCRWPSLASSRHPPPCTGWVGGGDGPSPGHAAGVGPPWDAVPAWRWDAACPGLGWSCSSAPPLNPEREGVVCAGAVRLWPLCPHTLPSVPHCWGGKGMGTGL